MKPLILRIPLAAAILFLSVLRLPAAEMPGVAVTGTSAIADTTVKPSAKVPPATGYYLTGKEGVFATFPSAPKLNSEIDHSDLLITLTVQSSRNSSQIEEAKNDAKYGDAIKSMTALVDPSFDTTYPESSKVAQLLKHASDDGAMIMYKLKSQNKRLRPYLQHPGLVFPLFTVKDFSYPSGHASGPELQARILSVLFPEHAAELMDKAKRIADSRVVAGVHYESDIEAGQQLGDLIFSQLSANPKFVQDLEAAKASISK